MLDSNEIERLAVASDEPPPPYPQALRSCTPDRR
ncbi:hypothetical protein COSO111634_38150 [Corallococcus soli]